MGHFKRVGRSVTKQTYRIPPRTTVAGMLAAIVGSDRDSYYDVFGADTSAIAITPLFDIRTVNVPTTGLGTDPKQAVTKTAGSRRSYALTYQDTEGDRQIHAYELLTDPVYRIDVAVEDEAYYEKLERRLETRSPTTRRALASPSISVRLKTSRPTFRQRSLLRPSSTMSTRSFRVHCPR